MRARDYLVYDGIEIANAARTLAYVRAAPIAITPGTEDCEAMGDGFVSVATDPAPWFDPDDIHSEAFLGMLAQVRYNEVAKRPSAPRSPDGATIGRRNLAGRLIQVSGILLATSEAGMFYGQRFIVSALAPEQDRSYHDARILPACDQGFRDLLDVGLVDGPTWSAPIANECIMQGVAFQMLCALPWLYRDAEECNELVIGS